LLAAAVVDAGLGGDVRDSLGSGLSTDHGAVGCGDIGDDRRSSDGCCAEDLNEPHQFSSTRLSLRLRTVFVAETVEVSTARVTVVVPVLWAASRQLQASLMPSRPRSSL
jgi:hypothetical protein